MVISQRNNEITTVSVRYIELITHVNTQLRACLVLAAVWEYGCDVIGDVM